MIKEFVFISLCVIQFSLKAQFNDIYLNQENSIGTAIGVKENPLTGEYFMPIVYALDGVNFARGYLKINEDGTLNDSIEQSSIDQGDFITVWNRGFFKTADGGYILASSGSGSDVTKLNQNLEIIWAIEDNPENDLICWGGGELGNGDLILGYSGESVPWNELRMKRYSNEGVVLDNFNVELDYDIGGPTTFIIDDSLLYISFSRLFYGDGGYRRNYIACYNGITGEEIWETHQIENGTALGFTDGFMCMTTDGQLKLVYVEQTALNLPGFFDSGWHGYYKVININPLSGEMSNESVLSGLELQSYVVDVAATDDGGFVVLFWGDDLEQPEYSFYGIMKISADMEVEWRNLYYQPIELEVYENASYLVELETTSDDCIVAVGDAMGTYFESQISIQHPWLLKVDACGNEMVSDCTLSGLSELSGRNKISIYPNPARDRVFLKAENNIQEATIFDMNGKIVHHEFFGGAQEQTLFIDHLPDGLYLVQATDTRDGRNNTKLLVTNY